jgi:membrane protease YdiL (CAAX protease family)
VPTPVRWQAFLVILISLLLAEYAHQLLSLIEAYRRLGLGGQAPFYVRSSARNLLQIALCFLVIRIFWAGSVAGVFRELGFGGQPSRGLAFGAMATSPMIIGLALTSSLAPAPVSIDTVYLAGVSPLAEEIIYRGFACGLLYTRARVPVWIAVALSGLVFGWGHADQGSSFAESLGLFLLIGTGGAAFGWFYLRWARNLWIPFGVHMFANLEWELFDVGDSPLGGCFPLRCRLP